MFHVRLTKSFVISSGCGTSQTDGSLVASEFVVEP